jgi:hypothetical protein
MRNSQKPDWRRFSYRTSYATRGLCTPSRASTLSDWGSAGLRELCQGRWRGKNSLKRLKVTMVSLHRHAS